MHVYNWGLIILFILGVSRTNAQTQKGYKIDTTQLYSTYCFLHQNPELSGNEIETSSLLKRELLELGFTIVDSLGLNSFAGVLKNGKGPTILYRTDMDALPILETTGVGFASSKTDNSTGKQLPIMHACGHDFHMTTWLGVAKTLVTNKKKWKGTIILLAQSSEETGQGAKGIVKASNFGKLPTADYQIAIHDTPDLMTGTFGFCDEYSMAAVDMMNITILGRGGHGAEPFKTIDPILLSANFIQEIQGIVSRNLAFNNPAVITVGAINGGTVGNIIPNSVELKLTIRTFSPENRAYILKRIEEIGNNLALAAGLSENELPDYKLLDMSIPPVYNNPALGELLQKSISNTSKSNSIVKVLPKMIGEDFGIYSNSNTIPSYLIWAGVKSPINTTENTSGSLHSSTFLPDYKSALPLTVEAITNCLIDLFIKN
ncbi:MAG: amidohydrolase [Crocinitomicaceae bacterium]|nr:amidohydrolase [Crocinitomicaceae bacterium]